MLVTIVCTALLAFGIVLLLIGSLILLILLIRISTRAFDLHLEDMED